MNDTNPSDGQNEPGPHTQRVQYNQIAARIPDQVSPGVFSNGVLIMQGQYEFIMDFVMTLARPHRVAARVIMPHAVLKSFLDTLQKNLDRHAEHFGTTDPPKPEATAPDAEGDTPIKQDKVDEADKVGIGGVTGPKLLPNDPAFEEKTAPRQSPSPEEIYDNLKLPDDVITGQYANAVLISHAEGEFCFDFYMRTYPKSVITSRIYLSTFQAKKLVGTLEHSWTQLQAKIRQARAQRKPPPGPFQQKNDPFNPKPDDDEGVV